MGKCSTCFVPGCNSGYHSCKEKRSLFSVPKDKNLFEKWKRAIPRQDKELSKTSAVCELHFHDGKINRYFQHYINGQTVCLPRERPCLMPDAIPSIFPNLPKYLSKPAPVSRKRHTSHTYSAGDEPANKKSFETSPESSSENDVINANQKILVTLKNVKLPSEKWVSHFSEIEGETLLFGVYVVNKNDNKEVNVGAQKLVSLTEVSDQVCGSVYIRNQLVRKIDSVDSEAWLEEYLQNLEESKLCNGAGSLNEFINLPNKARKVEAENLILHERCSGFVKEKGNVCLHCKYMHKLLLNQKSRKKCKKNVITTRNYTQRYVRRTRARLVRNLQKKFVNIRNKIKEMKLSNTALESNVLEERINHLPPKQQLCIRECFKAANRKSIKGMTYEKGWILECILMRMRSPKLYEYIRRHNILILPSRSCLRKYMLAYKTDFGFNPNMFDVMSEKTKTMDVLGRHGGISVDEMKISESFQVNSASGKIDGFVDLGPFTPENLKHTSCDHGLVIIFKPFIGDWQQILGVFASKGNVKGNLLAKILTEAIILTENAGLFVDFLTCDGATWNRSMWKEFGITAEKPKVKHPFDHKRHLSFISDFPHLIKCLRNTFVSKGFLTPEGEVRIEHVKCAWKIDSENITLKAMPKITLAHVNPNSFEKMRVNYI